MKPQGSHGKPLTAPKRHAKHYEVVELSNQGLARHKISAIIGLGERHVRRIVERELIEQKAKVEAAIDWNTLPGTMKDKAEVIRRQIRKELEDEFEPRFQAELRRRLESVREEYKELGAKARRVLDGRKGIITRDDYDLIRSCLHPDSRLSATDTKLSQAFRVFNEAEILFLNEKDCPTPKMTLPSLDELMKRKRTG